MEMSYMTSVWPTCLWFALPRWICSDELWVSGFQMNPKNAHALVFAQILCMSSKATLWSVLPVMHMHRWSVYVCPASSLLTHSPLSHFLCMCVCCFHSCFNAPKRPFDIPVEFLSVTLVCFMWCLRLWLFLFHADDPIIDLLSNWGLGECEFTSRFQ